MIGEEDAPSTYEYEDYYKILPVINDWGDDPLRIKDGKSVSDGFTYNSATNEEWMTREKLQVWLEANQQKLGKF